MKTVIRPVAFALAACISLLFSNCQKKVTDLQPAPTVDSAIINAMYPTVQSYNNGPVIYTYNYEYDKVNELVKYSRTDGVVTYNLGTNQVDINVNQYASSNHELIHTSTTSFVYSLAGDLSTAVNFFKNAPTQVKWTYFDKDVTTGTTSSRPGGLVQFENSKDGLPLKMISSDGGGYNINYNYDDKKNLIKIEAVNLSGPRANAVYQRISFSSFDDKPSPFAAVKAYWEASYPQAETWNYALAFCKNNPKKIVTELYDTSKNTFVINQQDDLTYVYNDKGYPTQITINTTYFNAVTTHYTTTYNYTYK